MIKTILDEMNLENGSNYKKEIVKKHIENMLFQEVVSKALDKVKWTWGITLKNIDASYDKETILSLERALLELEHIHNRTYTGNAAISHLTFILESVKNDDRIVIERIIGRDLRVNFGRTLFNKFLNKDYIITKPSYMRCSIYTEKTSKKINYPAFIQIKADGRYTSVEVLNGNVQFISRSGEEKEFPILKEYFKNKEDGIYIGELLLRGENNRSISNGNINSSEPDHVNIFIQLWDFITWEEWSRPKDKTNKTFYNERYKKLLENIAETNNVELIETHIINSKKEALKYVNDWMEEGLEGGILKDFKNIFINHTSPTQLKLKLEISLEMRVTGFIEGTKGTKREATFGSLMFENDEGTIKGSTSGFTDKLLKEINDNRDSWIGKVIEVECNDITKSRNSETYALSHPRFIQDRSDEKDTTDTLEKALLNKEMSMSI